MTTYELYINDILCDLSSDEVVTLLYQSPIFSSLDSIQSNRSYNIGLPPTPTNMRAIGQAARPDVDSDAPYVRLPAALYQDGMPLFTQGFAVVTDIADTINVTLTWGNADNFQPLFDSNLRDLSGTSLPDNIAWNENTELLDSTGEEPDIAFWGINFGMGLSNPKYLHPSVPVATILRCIEEYNGVTIDGKDRLAYSPHGGPIIPLVSKNGNEASGKAETTKCSPNPNDVDGYTLLVGDTIYFDEHSEYIQGNGFNVKGAKYITLNIKFHGIASNGTGDKLSKAKTYVCASDDYTVPLCIIPSSIKKDSLNRLKIDIDTEVSFSLENAIDAISIVIVQSETGRWNISMPYIMTLNAYPRDEVNYPSVFPIAPNLPDMSQGDFILAMMSMNGLFAYADKNSPNTIKLISIDDIIANVQNNDIIDWSDRVILNDIHRVDMPDASVFTIDDLAQSNILDYDNDDDVKTDTHGTITIRNENIEKETELVSLPFSASENVATAGLDRLCALVPIYEDDGKGGANYSECSPRILSARGTYYNTIDIKSIGVFDPWMKFGGEEGIVKARYSSYQKVVDRLRVISVRAKLTALDLYNLDYTKPVYIAQFGQIFAIYSVETGEDGICDCQLLKLKVDGVVPVHYNLLIGGNSSDFSIDVVAAGAEFAYSVETNGTPYIVSYDSRLTVSLNSEADTWELSIYVPENTSDAGIDYNPVILGISEDVSVRRKISISQQGKEYYLTLNGSIGDISLDTKAAAGHLRVDYSTNGTLQLSNSGDVIGATEVDGAYINIYTRANTSPEQRTGAVTLALQEVPSIVRKIVVIQSGVTIYTPSVAFSQALPWNAEGALLSMTNNGDVDLQVISIPDWFLYTAVPHDLAQGEDFAFGISQNTTGELRSGTVGMRYRDSTGRYVDYNVQVQQNAIGERWVIVDLSGMGDVAGMDITLLFQIAGYEGEDIFMAGDDQTIRLRFGEVASLIGAPELEDLVGDELYIEAPNDGNMADSVTVPETGDMHFVLA